jgi:L-fuculose-phosphate aldolase
LIGTAGNVSVREGHAIAITATGVVLADAQAADVVIVDASGVVVDGLLAPSSELGMHLNAYASDDTVRAVVHTHAPAATAVSLIVDELPCLHYQQLALGGAVPVVPFYVFGSSELAEAVREALEDKRAVILANHGSVTVGGTLHEAMENALLVEWAAELYLRASASGQPRSLTDEQQLAVVTAVISSGYGHTKSKDEH